MASSPPAMARAFANEREPLEIPATEDEAERDGNRRLEHHGAGDVPHGQSIVPSRIQRMLFAFSRSSVMMGVRMRATAGVETPMSSRPQDGVHEQFGAADDHHQAHEELHDDQWRRGRVAFGAVEGQRIEIPFGHELATGTDSAHRISDVGRKQQGAAGDARTRGQANPEC